MKHDKLVEALATLGFTAAARDTDAKLCDRLLDLMGDADCGNWDATLTAAAKQCVANFLKQFLKEDTAKHRAEAAVTGCTDFVAMWKRLLLEHCPPAPAAPDRSGKKVLVIAPGFGFLANPEQIRIVERAGFDVKRLLVPNPENSGFSMSKEIDAVLESIQIYRPDAILCASKGGAYMVKLWKMMEQDEIAKTPCLMINVHPQVISLPKDVKVELVQG